MCAAFKQSLFLPCVMPIDQMSRSREKKKKAGGRRRWGDTSVFINVWLMYSRVPIFQVLCFSKGKERSTEHCERGRFPPAGRDTQLGHSPPELWAPWGKCACHPFVRQRSTGQVRMGDGQVRMGGNTYSFFSRAKSSCSPSASIRSFSDAG